jgi:DNA polymerase I-like protein with 3'-5' exonuclease and polymerase domains
MPDKIPLLEIDIQKLAYRYHKIKEEGTAYFKSPERTLLIGSSLDIIRTYFEELFAELELRPVTISCDIETMFSALIDCIGFAWKRNEAICVPFCTRSNPYIWNQDEEIEILVLLRELFAHPNAIFVLQNGTYDAQFIYFSWKLHLRVDHDTMVMSHIMYNYMPKSLDFLASIYSTHYTYWKNMQNHGKES